MISVEDLNQRGIGHLPGHLGLVITHCSADEMRAELAVRSELMAPNGFLHAGAVVTLADTLCGYGCVVNLPEGATGFTTVELKSNHLGTARQGTLDAVARPVHRGRTTQVWDATVSHRDSGKTLALFRCTQMVLYAATGG
jgi:1,4-dihydroxy-2-naphthoyl-CoA hydrolase